MTIVIIYVTCMMHSSVYQTSLTREHNRHTGSCMLSKYAGAWVSVVFTCKAGLINRDMTKLIIAFLILRKFPYNGKKVVLCRLYQIQIRDLYWLFRVVIVVLL